MLVFKLTAKEKKNSQTKKKNEKRRVIKMSTTKLCVPSVPDEAWKNKAVASESMRGPIDGVGPPLTRSTVGVLERDSPQTSDPPQTRQQPLLILEQRDCSPLSSALGLPECWTYLTRLSPTATRPNGDETCCDLVVRAPLRCQLGWMDTEVWDPRRDCSIAPVECEVWRAMGVGYV